MGSGGCGIWDQWVTQLSSARYDQVGVLDPHMGNTVTWLCVTFLNNALIRCADSRVHWLLYRDESKAVQEVYLATFNINPSTPGECNPLHPT